MHSYIITFESCGVLNLTVPAPIIVTVTPSVIPIIFAGSSLNLTCTVELSPLVDVPVTVNTVWTGPAGFMTNNTAQPVMGNTTTYTSVVMVASIGRYQSENYSCTVNIGAISPFYADSVGYSSLRITVGKITCSYNKKKGF